MAIVKKILLTSSITPSVLKTYFFLKIVLGMVKIMRHKVNFYFLNDAILCELGLSCHVDKITKVSSEHLYCFILNI